MPHKGISQYELNILNKLTKKLGPSTTVTAGNMQVTILEVPLVPDYNP